MDAYLFHLIHTYNWERLLEYCHGIIALSKNGDNASSAAHHQPFVWETQLVEGGGDDDDAAEERWTFVRNSANGAAAGGGGTSSLLDFDGADEWGNTALHSACYNNPPVEVVQCLLTTARTLSFGKQSKVDMTLRQSKDGSTPLLVACATGASLMVIETLLKQCPAPHTLALTLDHAGQSPLSELCSWYQRSVKTSSFASIFNTPPPASLPARTTTTTTTTATTTPTTTSASSTTAPQAPPPPPSLAFLAAPLASETNKERDAEYQRACLDFLQDMFANQTQTMYPLLGSTTQSLLNMFWSKVLALVTVVSKHFQRHLGFTHRNDFLSRPLSAIALSLTSCPPTLTSIFYNVHQRQLQRRHAAAVVVVVGKQEVSSTPPDNTDNDTLLPIHCALVAFELYANPQPNPTLPPSLADENGNPHADGSPPPPPPLSLSVQCDNTSHGICRLLEACPSSARVPFAWPRPHANEKRRSVLCHAISTTQRLSVSASWPSNLLEEPEWPSPVEQCHFLQAIVTCAPSSVEQRDVATGLYPFLLAAAAAPPPAGDSLEEKAPCLETNDACTRHHNDDHHNGGGDLNTSFFLLRRAPQLVQPAAPPPPPPGVAVSS